MLRQLIEGLKNAQDGDESASTPAPLDVARCNDVLSRLEPLLENGDMGACALARTDRQVLQATLGASGASLVSAIEVFDFEQALAVLRAAREAAEQTTG